MTAVAVVVPTYNRRELTRRAVQSAVQQTRPADEIVLVDDGSADGTAEAIAEEFPQVQVERREHRGVSAARNHGVAVSEAEWIAFLDSDDEWDAKKLEVQLDAIAGSGYRIGHCDERWVRDGRRVNPRDKHQKRGGFIYRHCLPLCCISPSAVILERSLFDEVLGFDESLPACEDYDLWLKICFQYPVQFIARQLVTKYGGHDDQLSRSVEALDRYRVRALENAYRIPAMRARDKVATLEALLEKLEILIHGADKRDRKRAADYRRRRDHYRFLLRLEREWQYLDRAV